MMREIIEEKRHQMRISDWNFKDEVLDGPGPVMVEFWADWCGSCHLITSAVEGMARDYQGQVKVGVVDIDRNPLTARRYSVRSVPTIMFFIGGEIVDQITGVPPRRELVARLERVLTMPTIPSKEPVFRNKKSVPGNA